MLTEEELKRANALLADIRGKLESLSGGDKELLFAYRRKIFKELGYDDRLRAADGYTPDNTRLIHAECDFAHQASKGYA